MVQKFLKSHVIKMFNGTIVILRTTISNNYVAITTPETQRNNCHVSCILIKTTGLTYLYIFILTRILESNWLERQITYLFKINIHMIK